jgi:pimeloyl-ACP methyl ester carboxylesterase
MIADSASIPKAASLSVKEQAVLFGPGQILLGIESRPAPEARAAGRPAVILLNAGVVHRVGPHRLTVHVARRLAAAGFHVLRFDMAGLGDSARRKGSAPYQERAVQDVRDAMELVQQATGIDRFILGGLCSGADNSLRTAVADTRVAGIALLDPYAYRTPEFYVRRFLSRAREPGVWKRLARRQSAALIKGVQARLAKVAGGDKAKAEAPIELPRVPQYSRKFAPREEFGNQLRGLVDRGTAVLIAYSGSMDGVYNHAGQFDSAFRSYGLAGRVRSLYYPDANHTYTELSVQRRLIDAVLDWARTVPAKAQAR